MHQKSQIEKYQWWGKGECVVEVVRSGHFPDTVMVKLPNDVHTEVYKKDLENYHGKHA